MVDAVGQKRRRLYIYIPLLEYEYNGEVYQVWAPVGSNKPEEVGTVMRIRCNSHNPSEINVYEGTQSYMQKVWGIVAITTAGFAVATLILWRLVCVM